MVWKDNATDSLKHKSQHSDLSTVTSHWADTRQGDGHLDSMSDCTICEGQPGVLSAQTKPAAKNNLKCCLKKILIAFMSWNAQP